MCKFGLVCVCAGRVAVTVAYEVEGTGEGLGVELGLGFGTDGSRSIYLVDSRLPTVQPMVGAPSGLSVGIGEMAGEGDRGGVRSCLAALTSAGPIRFLGLGVGLGGGRDSTLEEEELEELSELVSESVSDSEDDSW